jgi:uncharacterized protein (TIGR02246 family)
MSGPDSDTVAGIRAAWTKWFAGMEASSVEQSLSVVSEDVVHEGPDGDRLTGREALRSALTAFHETYAERVRWDLQSVSVSEMIAEVRVREEATVRPRSGGPSMRAQGYHLARLAQQASGEWLIVEDVSRIRGEPIAIPHEFDLSEE